MKDLDSRSMDPGITNLGNPINLRTRKIIYGCTNHRTLRSRASTIKNNSNPLFMKHFGLIFVILVSISSFNGILGVRASRNDHSPTTTSLVITNDNERGNNYKYGNSNKNNNYNNHHHRGNQHDGNVNNKDEEAEKMPVSAAAFALLPTSAKNVFKCPEKFGYYPDSNDCSRYFVCVFGEPLHETCTGGLYFSAELQTCDWPRNVLCTNINGNPVGSSSLSFFDEVDESMEEGSRSTNLNSNNHNNDNNRNSRQQSVNYQQAGYQSHHQNTNEGVNRKRDEEQDLDLIHDKLRNTNHQPQRFYGHHNNYNNTSTTASSTGQGLTSSPSTNDVRVKDEPKVNTHTNLTFTNTYTLNNQVQNSLTTTESSQYLKRADIHSSPFNNHSYSMHQLLARNLGGYNLRLLDPGPLEMKTFSYTPQYGQQVQKQDQQYGNVRSEKVDTAGLIDVTGPHHNKILIDTEPQPPSYEAEAIPPLVDSKGGVHFSDGPGGTYGLTGQVPGIFYDKEDEKSRLILKNGQRKPHSGHSVLEHEKWRYNTARPSQGRSEITYDRYIPVIPPVNFAGGSSKEEYESGEGDSDFNHPFSIADAEEIRETKSLEKDRSRDDISWIQKAKSVGEVATSSPSHTPIKVNQTRHQETIKPTSYFNYEPHVDRSRSSVTVSGRTHVVVVPSDSYSKPERKSDERKELPKRMVAHLSDSIHNEKAVVFDDDRDDHGPVLENFAITGTGRPSSMTPPPVVSKQNFEYSLDEMTYREPGRGPARDQHSVNNVRSMIGAPVETTPLQPTVSSIISVQLQNRTIDFKPYHPYDSNVPQNQRKGKFEAGVIYDLGPDQKKFSKPKVPKRINVSAVVNSPATHKKELPTTTSTTTTTTTTPPSTTITTITPPSTTTTTTTARPTTVRTTTPRPAARTTKSRSISFKKSRPTNKRLIIKQKTTAAPKLPSRPESKYSTPIPLTQASKCDARICKLPDCNCGSTTIPGALSKDDTPQIVMITFDDAINDLNWEIYDEIFGAGRKNPNGCPILGTFYVSHEWTDYGQVQSLYSKGHEMASHGITHSFGEKFSKGEWMKEIQGQREILHLYGGVKLEDIRGMRAPFLQIGGNKMFEMLFEANFTYDSSMPVFDNKPPFYPYTLDYSINHECMIAPCPSKSFPGLWEVGMVMWEDLNGGRCSMGDACSNPSDEDGIYKMLMMNFKRHYNSNRAPFGLFYHSAWFTSSHHRRGFIKFLNEINSLKDVFFTTNWQMLQWMRDPTPLSRINSFEPWKCDTRVGRKHDPISDPCHHPSVCNVRHESSSRYMKTCQACPSFYPWVGKTGFAQNPK